MQQEKILFKLNTDQTITFPLGNSHESYGLESTINEIVDDTVRANINPAEDGEKTLFFADKDYTYDFFLFSSSNNKYLNNYAQIFTTNDFGSGFTISFLGNVLYSLDGTPRPTYSSSFYIMEIYDSVNSEDQNRLHVSYITLDPFNINYTYEETTIGFIEIETVTGASTTISLSNDQESSQFYISNDYLDDLTGNTLNAYARISFYNAKTGKILNLYNLDNSGVTITENLMYFDVTIDLENNTYSLESDTLTAYQYISNNYQNIVNSNIQNIINKEPKFRGGNTFTVGGKYIET